MTELEALQYKYDQAMRRMEEQRAVIAKLRKREDEWLACMEFKRSLVEFIGDELERRNRNREEWIEDLRTRRDED